MSEVDDVIREIFILDESDDIYVELNTNDVCQYDTAVQVVEALLPDHKKLAAARAVLEEHTEGLDWAQSVLSNEIATSGLSDKQESAFAALVALADALEVGGE